MASGRPFPSIAQRASSNRLGLDGEITCHTLQASPTQTAIEVSSGSRNHTASAQDSLYGNVATVAGGANHEIAHDAQAGGEAESRRVGTDESGSR